MPSETAIRDAGRCVAAAAHAPSKVILCGSYARGDAAEGSVLDLLVVEREIPDYAAAYLRPHRELDTLGIGVDLLLVTEDELERKRHWWTTPIYRATRVGKVLYEHP